MHLLLHVVNPAVLCVNKSLQVNPRSCKLVGALHIIPPFPVDLAMRRALKELVAVKRPYYRDGPQESDMKEFTDEHICIWKGGDKELEDVLKFFGGEK